MCSGKAGKEREARVSQRNGEVSWRRGERGHVSGFGGSAVDRSIYWAIENTGCKV